jgi:hypothetical protein
MTFEERVEKAARALAPLAWSALGTGDTAAQANRRKASLRHAASALRAGVPEYVPGWDHEVAERIVRQRRQSS